MSRNKVATSVDEPFPRWYDGRPLVACRMGPFPNSWEYLENWLTWRREQVATGGFHRVGYVPTGQLVKHPDHPGIKGALLVWDAQRAVAVTDEQWLQLLPAETRRVMA